MKKHFATLVTMGINFEDFYAIGITSYDLKLQGKATQSTIQKIKNMGVELALDSSGFLDGTIIIDETPVNFTLTF